MTDAELHREAADLWFGAADPARDVRCPECGSDDIAAFQETAATCWIEPTEYTCRECGEEWTA